MDRVINDTLALYPEDVASRVAEAGRVIWADPSAAANRLRLAIEQVLDHEGVARCPWP